MDNPKQKAAALEYATTGNASHAARKAGVNRSTVMRWLNDAGFQELVREVREPAPSPEALKSLSDLVPKAVEVVEQGLAGEATVSAARIALDVIKVAAQMQPKGSTDDTPPLANLLAELDAKNES